MTLLLLSILCPLFSPVFSVIFNEAAGTVSLKVSNGELLGKRIDSYDDRTGYGFLGVPFGAPTGGEQRFRKPQPASAWEGVRNVTRKGDACAAVAALTYKKPEGGPMSEDCLHAYVYASKKCLTKGGCAILWVLHGGKYNFESPVIFDDDVVVHNFASDNQDVVVVIPAYRLINFGFLNLAPGLNSSATPNAAIWDLLLAMEWTKREIHNFGGDPDRITVFGHSAGAQFADIISTSPHFAGFFSRMVLMSGAETTLHVPIGANSAASWITAQQLGCADEQTNRTDLEAIERILACMRSKTWEEIAAANVELNNRPEDYHGPYPDGLGGVLPDAPSVLALARPPISVMMGTTSAELHDTKYALKADGSAILALVSELCEGFCYTVGYEHPEEMTSRCVEYYMQSKNAQNFEEDIEFFQPTFVAARSLAKKGNKVYLYSFTYTGVGGAFKKYLKLDKDDHPSHSEDFVYILGLHRGNFTQKDYEIERIYSGMVLNFVRTGYPQPAPGQPAWLPFSKITRQYYRIDFDANNRMPGIRNGYEAAAIKLWVDDAEKFGGRITPPVEFPDFSDKLFPMDMTTAYASHYMNKSFAHDKTLETEEVMYTAWKDYVASRRLQHLQGVNNFRSANLDSSQTPIVLGEVSRRVSMMEIVMICVSAVLIFLLFRSIVHWAAANQQRKGYEEL